MVHINRGLVFWGVALITAGAVALAIQSGTITSDFTRELWRLWPIVLIVIGLSIIAARTPFGIIATILAGLAVGGLGGSLIGGIPDGISIGCGGEPDQAVTRDGAFTGDAAEVNLDFDCGELDVTMAAGEDWSLDAGYGGSNAPNILAEDARLTVEAQGGSFVPFNENRQEWQVVLPTEVTIDLSVNANAASSDLDLTDADLSALSVDANAGSVDALLAGAEVGELSIDANAGSVDLIADEATRFSGEVGVNAGSVDLCVPDGAAVAITLDDEDNVTFSHNLDERHLTREGDTWRSGSGDADITLRVEGNAASFNFNPDEGCEE